MIRTIVLVSILASIFAEPRSPYQTNEYRDGPVYRVPKVQKVGGDCQLRRYFPSTWVATTPQCFTPNSTVNIGFLKLFFYMNRWNLNRESYRLTQPTVIRFQMGGSDCVKTHQQMKYLSRDLGSKPAVPMDDTLTFVKMPITKMYVTEYRADPMDAMACHRYMELLRSELLSKRVNYNKSEYFCARYDPQDGDADKLRFEVWIPLQTRK